MNIKNLIFLIICFSLAPQLSSGQKVSGYIKNEQNEAIPFAAISIQGTTTGATADENGFFTLASPLLKGNVNLLIRSTGYEEKTYPLIFSEKPETKKIEVIMTTKVNYMNTVVITGTRTNRMLKDEPVLTKVVSANELSEMGSVTVFDALENIVPGISFSPDAHGDNISVQGLDNKYVLVLVDGERVSGEGRNGNVNFSRLNVADVQQIEIVNGASSVLYGSNAMGAVINIITKKVSKPVEAFAQARYFPSIDSYILDAGVGFKSKKCTSKTYVNYKNNDGYTIKEPIAIKDSVAKRTVNPDNDFTISQDFGFTFNPNLQASIGGSFFMNELFNKPGALASAHNLNYDYTLRAKVNYKISDQHEFSGSVNSDNFINYRILERKNDEKDKETQYSYTTLRLLDVWNIHKSIQLVGGYELNDETAESSKYFGNEESEHQAYNHNFFLQGEYKTAYGLDILGGLRYTYHSEFKSHLAPKISALYKLNDFRFRGTVSNGYREPSLKEMYYHFNMANFAEHIGNPDLKPENAWYESFSVEYLTYRLNLSASIYHNFISNKINIVQYVYPDQPLPQWHYENIEEARIYGIETSLQYFFLKYFTWNLSYAYTNATDLNTGESLANTSAHSGTTMLVFKSKWACKDHERTFPFSLCLSGRIASPIEYSYDEEMIDSKWTSVWKFVYSQQIPIKNRFGMELQFGVDNIFDWKDIDISINPGRTYFMGIKLKI